MSEQPERDLRVHAPTQITNGPANRLDQINATLESQSEKSEPENEK